jgi:membrane-associated phospholipid phosphatase
MRKTVETLLLAALLSARLGAQETQTAPQGAPQGREEASERPISWGRLLPNILDDQKHIFAFPIEVGKGRHLGPTLAFSFGTWTAIALDPADAPYFSRTQTFTGFNNAFTGTRTIAGVLGAPAALYVAGLVGHDRYLKDTSLLAIEAAGDAGLVDVVMKSMTRRLRPSDIAPGGDFTHTFYGYKGGAISGSTSFPSGHAITAFAVASVVAHRYHRKRWVPWVAYSLASTVAFSRVTLRAHFPSDVLAGGVLGFVIGRQVERGWGLSPGGPNAPGLSDHPETREKPLDGPTSE